MTKEMGSDKPKCCIKCNVIITKDVTDKKWRMATIFSYVIILIGFGIPLWWGTTRVYRAPLPLEEMLELRPEPLPPLKIFINAASGDETENIIKEMNHVLGSSVILTPYSFLSSKTLPPGSLLLEERANHVEDITMSPHQVIYFKPGVGGNRLANLLRNWPGVQPDTALIGGPNLRGSDVTKGRSFPAVGEYDVMVTVVENNGKRMKWDLVEGIEEYLHPYLASFSPVSNFTVKSSWVRYAALGVRGRRVALSGALPEAILAQGAAPLEARLPSPGSPKPQIHVVLYVVPCDEAPLYIYNKSGQKISSPLPAFVSPRWGGVQILNPDCSDAAWAPPTALVMRTAAAQLSTLLGVPTLPGVAALASETGGVAAWQRDWMVRGRTKEYLDSARLTLRSLAQLLSEISNIVIRDDVAASVERALECIKSSQRYLVSGDTIKALEKAQRAFEEAEAAFTDPSLLALLYFPDDQKYAVYIPLFLPIMIPVIMSTKQLVFYLKKNK